ncbi:uncharacterized protein LOC9301674 [Arabidopsis lyrata subsp. lyrata]|nr:uncharacterized protein LOC9301674 [Arabidopsis lyrata subsp. lyrata]|eukprot:XP_002863858.2 uncharacterized protein LOC9301674 [Arabidopsis lyrata subsp. lyrata]
MVLWSGPYSFNGWLVLLQKWEDEQGPDFLNSVPMWLRIRGIPIRYLCEGTVREIASSMGEIMEVELDDVKFDFRFVRVRVNVSVDTRLCFKKVVRFGSGEVRIVSLRYEDIAWSKVSFKFYRNCGGLNHLARSCSRVWVDVPDPYDRALSPPPLDSSVDGSGEKNGEGGRSLGLLEQIDPADASADAVQGLPDGVGEQKGLDGVEDGNVTQVKVGTSPEGSKRKFDAGDQEDDIVEKRLKGSADAVQDLPNGDGEQGGLDGVEEGNVTLVQSEGVGVNLKPLEEE